MVEKSTGFTLLELLVVMVLAGVLLALVVPALSPGPAQQARQHGLELLSLLHLLRERAVTEGQDHGLRIEPSGYTWLAQTRQGWRPQKSWPLPDGLRFRLEMEGQALTLVESTEAPQILILSNDELSAFSLHYENGHENEQGRWLTVSSDGLNDAVIRED